MDKEYFRAGIVVGLVVTAICVGASMFSQISPPSAENTSVVAAAEDDSVFSTFGEITEDELVGKLGGDVKFAGVAGPDFYLECGDGSRYVCRDVDESVRQYAAFAGVDVMTISANRLDDWPGDDQADKADGGPSMPVPSFLLAWMLTSFAGVMVAVRVVRMRKERSGTGQVQSGPAQASKNVPDSVFTDAVCKPELKKRTAGADVPSVRFSDVEGVDALKADVARLVDCLTNPGKYAAMGARTPKGVILYGPPGTGKTLLARAIAGEASVPFLSACGSDFIEKYVGVGAKRVRELYERAKAKAPCIVFIDEIDAVASKRGTDENSERDQTVNALLAALDGFDSRTGIVTICATNRLELLDNAFKRAGRFDLKLAVGLPDREARENILKVHSRNKPLREDVDLSDLARRCAGFSGADLEAMMNEAAMNAAGGCRDAVSNEDVDEAFFKIVLQGNKLPVKKAEERTRLVAWHEAGHALVTKLLTDDAVPSVTIAGSSAGTGGVTFRAPREEVLPSKEYLKSLICVMYGGRAAEEVYLGDAELVTTGAGQDIKQATEAIRDYIGRYGMGDMGMLDVTQFGSGASKLLDEAKVMASECYGRTLALLREHSGALEAVASELLERETLSDADLDRILAGCGAVAV